MKQKDWKFLSNSAKRLPEVVLILIIVLSVASIISVVRNLEALPSPIFGGDYYFQAGVIEHVASGGAPWVSSSMVDGIAGYGPLYGILGAFFRMISGSTLSAMILITLCAMVAGIIVHYFLFRQVTSNKLIAILITAFFVGPRLIFKYTELTEFVLAPFFLYVLIRFYNYSDTKNLMLLALSYLLLAWTNNIAFAGAVIIGIIVTLYGMLRKKNMFAFARKHKMIIAVLLIVSVLLILPVWFRPLIGFGLQSSYDRTHMDFDDYADHGVQINFVGSTIKNIFWNFSSVVTGLRTLLVWTGLVSLFLWKRKDKREMIIVLALAAAAVLFSYFITEPLLSTNIVPSRQSGFWILPVIGLIAAIGGQFVVDLLHRRLSSKRAVVPVVLIACAVIVLIMNAYSFVNGMQNNRFVINAGRPIAQHHAELQEYVKSNIPVDQVFLSSKEESFMIHALTGRKVFVSRWAHQNDPFLDIPQRDLEAAIILYGNDTVKRRELLSEIDYLFWEENWIRTEFTIDNKGNVVGTFDPLIVYDSPDTRDTLERYNISYIPQHTWVDPSQKRDTIRMFDMLIISPANYRGMKPWAYDLEEYIEPVWNYTLQERTVAQVWRVRT